MSLEKVDVKDCAEDNEKLAEIFKQKTGYDTACVEDWQSGRPPKARGPYNCTTALVIKHNSGSGTVKVFSGNTNVATYQTHPDSKEEVNMVFLSPGYYCWWTLDAQAKHIA